MNTYIETLQHILAQVDESLRVMPARDDSLVRRFRRRDLLIIDPRDTDVRGGVVLMDLDGKPAPLEVKRMPDGMLRYTKHDMLWRPIELTPEEALARSMGRVVGAVVRFRPERC